MPQVKCWGTLFLSWTSSLVTSKSHFCSPFSQKSIDFDVISQKKCKIIIISSCDNSICSIKAEASYWILEHTVEWVGTKTLLKVKNLLCKISLWVFSDNLYFDYDFEDKKSQTNLLAN